MTNNLFVGKTSSFSEKLDIIDNKDHNILLSGTARGHGSRVVCGKIGMEMTTFSSGPNGIPLHPLVGIHSYQTIRGETRLKGEQYSGSKIFL